jgi:hypothetical protein
VAFAVRRRPITRRGPRGDDGARTSTVLDELAELERAHRAGDVGPKTYARTRRELLERLARALRDGRVEEPNAGGRAPGVPA